jgi:hypothetical protein
MRARALVAGLIAVGLVAFEGGARGDCASRPNAGTCLTSDALWPMPGTQRFAYVAGTELPAAGAFDLALVTSYQRRPVVLHTPGAGDGDDVAAIDDQLNATLVGSLALVRRLALHVAAPVTLYETGSGSEAITGRPPPAASSVRDPRAGLGLALLPRTAAGLVAVTAYVDAQVPTRATTDFAGEKGVVLVPMIATDLRPAERLSFGLAASARVRPVVESLAGERQGTQGLLAIGARAGILPRELLSLGLEAQGILGFGARAATVADSTGLRDEGPSRAVLGGEWLASLRTAILDSRLAFLAGGGGTLPFGGLVGVGAWRAVASVSFALAGGRGETARAHEVAAAPPTPERPHEPSPLRPQSSASPNPCHATCTTDSFSPMPQADAARLSADVAPFLEDLRGCLARVGAERIRPAVLVRFSDSGVLVDLRVDMGGYEDLACVKDVGSRWPALATSRGTTARCELECR